MAALQPLQALNKSSARVAAFAVRPCSGQVGQYTYTSKNDQRTVTASKFEVWLVGNAAKDYCIGFVKGTEKECKDAKKKYTDDTVWALSKVSLDSYTALMYISTPVPFRVDLTKSKMTICEALLHKELHASQPKHPEPPRSVADVARIATNRATDLIAMVKDVSAETRKTKSDENVVDVELLDDSMANPGKLAVIMVSVFGTHKIEQLKQSIGQPMAFFNISVVCNGRGNAPQVNHYSGELMKPAPKYEKRLTARQAAGPRRRDEHRQYHSSLDSHPIAGRQRATGPVVLCILGLHD